MDVGEIRELFDEGKVAIKQTQVIISYNRHHGGQQFHHGNKGKLIELLKLCNSLSFRFNGSILKVYLGITCAGCSSIYAPLSEQDMFTATPSEQIAREMLELATRKGIPGETGRDILLNIMKSVNGDGNPVKDRKDLIIMEEKFDGICKILKDKGVDINIMPPSAQIEFNGCVEISLDKTITFNPEEIAVLISAIENSDVVEIDFEEEVPLFVLYV